MQFRMKCHAYARQQGAMHTAGQHRVWRQQECQAPNMGPQARAGDNGW